MKWSIAFNALLAEGFAPVNAYGDGVVRFERPLPNGDTLFTFLRANGDHQPPKVWEALVEDITAAA